MQWEGSMGSREDKRSRKEKTREVGKLKEGGKGKGQCGKGRERYGKEYKMDVVFFYHINILFNTCRVCVLFNFTFNIFSVIS